ncbi:MAG: hypothetical protein DCC75_00025 [Proteobacteria bacterium]|nr:MAG: hypothetical protein DCC75_00025 [Pseudomonadota bacterium]
MEHSFNIKHKLLPYGYAVEYQLKLDLKRFTLPLVVDGCLKDLIPDQAYQEQLLMDIKGRDPMNLIDHNISETCKPDADELIYIAGELLACEAQLPVTGWQGSKLPFEVRVNTRFKEFVGAKHISHSLQVERKGALPHDIPIRELGWVFPVRIKNFRLGVDFFASPFLSNWLGFTPTVFQTLLIEADESAVNLKIISEGMKSRSAPPLPVMDQVCSVMKQALGFSIEEHYQSALSSNGE